MARDAAQYKLLEERTKQIKKELVGPRATPRQRLVAERIGVTQPGLGAQELQMMMAPEGPQGSPATDAQKKKGNI